MTDIKTLTLEEAGRLHKAVWKRGNRRDICLLVFLTLGVRWRETLPLRVSDIQLYERAIRVKERVYRSDHVSRIDLSILKKYLKIDARKYEGCPDTFVFPSETNSKAPMSYHAFRTIFRSWLSDAGLDLRIVPHALRAFIIDMGAEAKGMGVSVNAAGNSPSQD